MNSEAKLDNFTSNHLLLNLLNNATESEKLQLTRILEGDTTEPFNFSVSHSPEILMKEITIAGGNSIANSVRQQGNSYWDILDDVAVSVLKKEEFNRYSSFEQFDNVPYFNKKVREYAKKMYLNAQKIDFTKYTDPELAKVNFLNELESEPERFKNYIPYASKVYEDHFNKKCLDLEERIFFKLVDIKYSAMSDEEKKKFDQAVYDVAVEKGLTSSRLSKGVAGLIILGEMGGFTTYMLMSIFLSKIGLGVFGFGVFTGASTLLGVILGPAGWIASGTWVLWEIMSPSKNKMTQIVVTIGLIRLRLEEEEKVRLAEAQREKEKAKLAEAQRVSKANPKKSATSPKNFKNRIRFLLGYPQESPEFSYQNLKFKKNKKGRKKF